MILGVSDVLRIIKIKHKTKSHASSLVRLYLLPSHGRDRKDSHDNLQAFKSSTLLYDCIIGRMRIKRLCIENMTPYPLNLDLITLFC